LHERRLTSQFFKITLSFNDNLKGSIFMKFIKRRLLNPRTIFHFKQLRYIVTTMNGNSYIGRQFTIPFIASTGSDIFHVLDVSESMEKDRNLSFMLPVSFTQSFTFFGIFAFAALFIFYLYSASSTFRDYIKINPRYLYSLEAL
jgi:hypothetical protein